MSFDVHPTTRYQLACWRAGVCVWAVTFPNLVTTAGKNALLDATFKTGLAVPAWYVGLVDNAGFTAYAVTDTMAAHAGWVESSAYTDATRPAFTMGTIAAGSGDNSAAKATFHMNTAITVRGAFLTNNSTVSGTTGTLYGVGDVTVSQAVQSGDVVYATATLSMS